MTLTTGTNTHKHTQTSPDTHYTNYYHNCCCLQFIPVLLLCFFDLSSRLLCPFLGQCDGRLHQSSHRSRRKHARLLRTHLCYSHNRRHVSNEPHYTKLNGLLSFQTVLFALMSFHMNEAFISLFVPHTTKPPVGVCYK